MTYKEALGNLLVGKVVANNECAANKKFKFDRRTHGIRMYTGRTYEIIGPTAFANLSRTSNCWEII